MGTDPFAAFPERSSVIARGFSPALDRALYVGAAVAAVLGIALELVLGRVLPPVIAPLVVALIAAVIATAAGLLAIPRPLGRAYESFSWLGRAEVSRFQARTGGPVPTDPEEIDRWLATAPPTASTSLPRVELLAFIGRFDDARSELAALGPGATPMDAFERASLAQYVGWLETGSPGLAALQAAVDALPPGSEERRMGEVNVALGQARILGMAGDASWFAPLEGVRAGLGRGPIGVVWRDTGRRLGVVFWIVALIAACATELVRAFTGSG